MVWKKTLSFWIKFCVLEVLDSILGTMFSGFHFQVNCFLILCKSFQDHSDFLDGNEQLWWCFLDGNEQLCILQYVTGSSWVWNISLGTCGREKLLEILKRALCLDARKFFTIFFNYKDIHLNEFLKYVWFYNHLFFDFYVPLNTTVLFSPQSYKILCYKEILVTKGEGSSCICQAKDT